MVAGMAGASPSAAFGSCEAAADGTRGSATDEAGGVTRAGGLAAACEIGVSTEGSPSGCTGSVVEVSEGSAVCSSVGTTKSFAVNGDNDKHAHLRKATAARAIYALAD